MKKATTHKQQHNQRTHSLILHAPEIRELQRTGVVTIQREIKFKSAFSFPHIAYKFCWPHSGGGWVFSDANIPEQDRKLYEREPHGMLPPFPVGARVAVKETWQVRGLAWNQPANMSVASAPSAFYYRATDEKRWPKYWGKWRHPASLPLWAVRFRPTVASVRVVKNGQWVFESTLKLEPTTPATGKGEIR